MPIVSVNFDIKALSSGTGTHFTSFCTILIAQELSNNFGTHSIKLSLYVNMLICLKYQTFSFLNCFYSVRECNLFLFCFLTTFSVWKSPINISVRQSSWLFIVYIKLLLFVVFFVACPCLTLSCMGDFTYQKLKSPPGGSKTILMYFSSWGHAQQKGTKSVI